MTTLTNDELQAIRARAEAATPGPWYIGKGGMDGFCLISEGICLSMNIIYPEDRFFITNSRTDIPALLKHIEAQQADKAVLVEALMYIVNDDNYLVPTIDPVSIAATALARAKGTDNV